MKSSEWNFRAGLLAMCLLTEISSFAQSPTLTLVNDLYPGTNSSAPNSFVTVNGKVIFLGRSKFATGMWATDGTELGISYLTSSRTIVEHYTLPNGTLLYSGSDGDVGEVLRKTDGTPAGSAMVKLMRPGPGATDANHFTKVGTNVLFLAGNGTFWRTDGTEAGTLQVGAAVASMSRTTPIFLSLGEQVTYFSGPLPQRMNMKGDILGPSLTSKIPFMVNKSPGLLGVVFGQLLFRTCDDTNGCELWVTDWTVEGTHLLKDINPGPSASFPDYPVVLDNTLYFFASNSTAGIELWKSDGTTNGTLMVTDHLPRPAIKGPIAANMPFTYGGRFFWGAFEETTNSLWSSDGTTFGTVQFRAGGSLVLTNPTDFRVLEGMLYFTSSGNIWQSDGTEAGTRSILPAIPGYAYTVLSNQIYFRGFRADVGIEMFKLSAEPRVALNVSATATTLSLVLAAPANQRAVLEVSSDLIEWHPLRTNKVSANGIWVLEEPLEQPSRFYKARWIGP
jgi:ELWxxDGT repeat protein